MNCIKKMFSRRPKWSVDGIQRSLSSIPDQVRHLTTIRVDLIAKGKTLDSIQKRLLCAEIDELDRDIERLMLQFNVIYRQWQVYKDAAFKKSLVTQLKSMNLPVPDELAKVTAQTEELIEELNNTSALLPVLQLSDNEISAKHRAILKEMETDNKESTKSCNNIPFAKHIPPVLHDTIENIDNLGDMEPA